MSHRAQQKCHQRLASVSVMVGLTEVLQGKISMMLAVVDMQKIVAGFLSYRRVLNCRSPKLQGSNGGVLGHGFWILALWPPN